MKYTENYTLKMTVKCTNNCAWRVQEMHTELRMESDSEMYTKLRMESDGEMHTCWSGFLLAPNACSCKWTLYGF